MSYEARFQLGYQVLLHARQADPNLEMELVVLYDYKTLLDCLAEIGYLPVYQELFRLHRLMKLVNERTADFPKITDPDLKTEIRPSKMTESMAGLIRAARETAWAAYHTMAASTDYSNYKWLRNTVKCIREGRYVDVDYLARLRFKGVLPPGFDPWTRQLKGDEAEFVQAIGGGSTIPQPVHGLAHRQLSAALDSFLRSRGRL